MINLSKYTICILLIFVSGRSSSQVNETVINVSDFGIQPNTRLNIEPVIRKILREHQDSPSIILQFSQGRYDFWPYHSTEALFSPSVAFDLAGMKNVTVDGGGASFIFHGRMMPFRIEHAEGIKLRNFSIDWERPFISQAQVAAVGENWLDLRIDAHAYPYEIEGDSIYFTGEGWRSPITHHYNNLYDRYTGDIVYQTRDNPLGGLPEATVTELQKGLVRFHFTPDFQPDTGTYVAMYHGSYITDGILILNSKNTVLEKIDIYHTLSCGVSGYRSENISLKQVNIIVNEAKGRVFSTVADATHFNGCKGVISIDGTTISGAGDDFTNIHGMYAQIIDVPDNETVLISPGGRYIGFDPGERAWLVDTTTMQRTTTLTVQQQEAIWKDGKVEAYRITFASPHDNQILIGSLLENKDRNPDVYIRNCRILKKNRARGALVTTAGKVVIENNYFNTAGAAILIEGDTDLWYESGGTRDVLIQNNIFEDCYTSGNNIEDSPWGWGEGVITITPSVTPNRLDFPAYHRNIRILDNKFLHYDYAILYARSVSSLTFSRNVLLRTFNYEPFYRPVTLFFDGCEKVALENNQFGADFLGQNIHVKHMRKQDIKQSGKSLFSISDD